MSRDLNDAQAFIDGSFAPAKKGDRRLEKRSVAKERKSWPWQLVMVFPFLSVLKGHPSRSEVGRSHPGPDGDSRSPPESDRRQGLRVGQTGPATQ